MKWYAKTLWLLLILLTALGVSIGYMWRFGMHHYQTTSKELDQHPKQVAMHIFVHGSFGTPLGLLSFFHLVTDDIRGSTYQKVTKKMRADSFFFESQPVLERGLHRITPTFDLDKNNGKKYAAYPIIKAYDVIHQQVNQHKQDIMYYTFGWSGLLSQNARRYESIRFYNALHNEIKRLKREENIIPKISIIAHSHGGNLALNLALVSQALDYDFDQPLPKRENMSKKQYQALKNMHEQLNKLPSREIAQLKEGQKAWDYLPDNASLVIDELIMYGSPIQEETEHCLLLDTFCNIFNFYSTADIVQASDWISTKNMRSGQRFCNEYMQTINEKKSEKDRRIVQARLMVGRSVITDSFGNPLEIQENEDDAKSQSIFSRLLSGKTLFVKNSPDPNHKELWFFSWKNKNNKNNLSFLPAVIMTPLILHAFRSIPTLQDAQVNMYFDKKQVHVGLTHYHKTKIQHSVRIPRAILEKIKKAALSWQPNDLSSKTEFNIIEKYKASVQAV